MLPMFTWFPNHMPNPSMILPNISIERFAAEALKVAPIIKLVPPHNMLPRRPYFRVMGDATRDATRPAR